MQQRRLWNRNFILIFITNITTSISFQMMNTTLAKYTVSLGLSVSIMGFVSTSFVITSLAIRPYAGRLCDYKNKKKILLISLILIAVAILGYSQSHSLGYLIFFRLIHGLGWGLVTTVSSTIATVSLPEEKIGHGIGIFALASVISTAIAPNLGLWLIDHSSYTIMFMSAAAMPLTGILLSFFIQTDNNQLNNSKRTNMESVWNSIFAKEAVLPMLIILFTTVSTSSISTFLALYAEERAIAGIGLFFSVYAVALFVTRPVSGRLNDILHKSFIIIPCSVLLILTFVLLTRADRLLLFTFAAVTYGLGYGGLQPALQTWCVKSVNRERRGVANSTFFVGLDLGTSLGTLVAGGLAQWKGYRFMYESMIMPILIALFIYLLTGTAAMRKIRVKGE